MLHRYAKRFVNSPPAQQIVSRWARYDAAQTTDENYKHWSNADLMGPRSANDRGTRERLTSRARYERDNNSYAMGMVATVAGDLIGTGPRLSLLTENDVVNRFFEQQWNGWADAIDLGSDLEMLDGSGSVVDGEGLSLLIDNPLLFGTTEVTLDLRVIECDYLAGDPMQLTGRRGTGPASVDGVEFDRAGNPARYRVLREHPGDAGFFGNEADWHDAAKVLHWFRPLRAGQVRGIPEITPALPLYAQLRRYSLAVLMAAELAAELAAFIQTELPADGAEAVDPMEVLEIVRGMITSLPAGWTINQLRPEQPTTGYGEFCDRIIKEIARCLELPFAIAAGDSSSYNYASGRLDVQTYQRRIRRRRHRMAVRILNRIWRAWMDEAVTVKAYRPMLAGMPPFGQWPITWMWDGFEHVDPVKEAQADALNYVNGFTTKAAVCGKRGEDWEDVERQRVREKSFSARLAAEAGVEADGPATTKRPALPGDPVPQDQADAQDPADTADSGEAVPQ